MTEKSGCDAAEFPHQLRFESKKGENLCSVSLEWRTNREISNCKQHFVWFVSTGMDGLRQNVLLNFRLEFPKSDLTVYLPSQIFCQMASTPVIQSSDQSAKLFKQPTDSPPTIWYSIPCYIPFQVFSLTIPDQKAQ